MSTLENRAVVLANGQDHRRDPLNPVLNKNLGVPEPSIFANNNDAGMALRQVARDLYEIKAPEQILGDTTGNNNKLAKDLYETAYLGLSSRSPADRKIAQAAIGQLTFLDGQGTPEARAALNVLQEQYGSHAVTPPPQPTAATPANTQSTNNAPVKKQTLAAKLGI